MVLGSAAFSLVRIHPYELSYYNELIGGPRGAWERGFELTYWYDAFTDKVIADLNRQLPPNAEVDFFNDLTNTSVIVFQELQSLGVLRGDIGLAAQRRGHISFHLAVDAGFKGCRPSRGSCSRCGPGTPASPRQLDGAQVASVADPVAVSRAYALRSLLDAPDRSATRAAGRSAWVRDHVPWLARFWGDGLIKAKATHSEPEDPRLVSFRSRGPAGGRPLHRRRNDRATSDKNAQRLMELMTTETNPSRGPKITALSHRPVARSRVPRPWSRRSRS